VQMIAKEGTSWRADVLARPKPFGAWRANVTLRQPPEAHQRGIMTCACAR